MGARKMLSQRSLLALGPILLLAVILVFAGMSFRRGEFLIPPRAEIKGFAMSGDVCPDGVYAAPTWLAGDRPRQVKIWGTFCKGGDSYQGEAVSTPFRGPSTLSVFLSGYPEHPGIGVAVENMETGQSLSISRAANPAERLQLAQLRLPADWVGQWLRLRAVDRSSTPGGWVAFSEPVHVRWWNLQSADSWPMFIAYLLCFPLFWIPGRLLALWSYDKVFLRDYLLLPLGLTVSTLLGYVVFWIYFISPDAGYVFSVAIILLTMVACLKAAIPLKNATSQIERLWPKAAVYSCIAGLLYLALFSLHGRTKPHELMADISFFEEVRPGDDLLPSIFAQAIVSRTRLTGLSGAGWYFSDRPPLQTGLVLAYSPIAKLVGWADYYQAAGTVIQVQFFVVLISLCELLCFSSKKARFILLMCGLSGFAFYHSIFVWPKLISGALGIAAMLPFLAAFRERRFVDWAEVLVGAFSATLALLAHGAVAFTMIPLATFVLLLYGRYYRPRSLAIGALAAATLYVPWVLFQTYVVPNQGHLVKLHLTGVSEPTPQPLFPLLLNSYARLGWHGWIGARLNNTTKLVRSKHIDDLTEEIVAGIWNKRPREDHLDGRQLPDVAPDRLHYDFRSLGTILRISQRELVFPSLDFLNVSWILLFIAVVRTKGRWLGQNRQLAALLAVNFATVLVWVILEFGPGWTIVTHASFTMMLLFFFLAGTLLYDTPVAMCWTFATLHILFGLVFWVLLMPGLLMVELLPYSPTLQVGPLLIAVLCICWMANASVVPEQSDTAGETLARARKQFA